MRSIPRFEESRLAVIITPDSELGRELVKWEQHQTHYVGQGQSPGNPYQYRAFPKMVYRAVKKANGKVVCMEPPPPIHLFKEQNDYNVAVAQAEVLVRECHRVVHNEDQYLVAKGQGWTDDPKAAVEQFEREEQAVANAAAEAAYAVQKMSEKARSEFENVERQTDQHITDIAPASKKRIKEQA